MKVLDVDSLMSGLEDGVQSIDDLHEKISAVQRSIRDFHAMEDALSGKGGDSIRNFFNEVHQPFLIFLYQTLQNYKNVLTKMQSSVTAFESNPNGMIRQDFLENEVMGGFEKVKSRTMELTDNANNIINSVSDLVNVDPIDDTEVLETVERGKKKVRTIVEDLHTLDKAQVKAMESVRADLQTMRSYLADVESKVKRGDLSVVGFNSVSVRNIDGYSAMMDRIYDNDKTEKLGNKPVENMSMKEIEKAKDDMLDNLDDYGKEVLSEAYKALENGEINKDDYQFVLNLLLDTEESLANTKEQDKNDLMQGEVVFEGDSRGQHEITKGVEGNLKELGISYDTLRFEDNEIEINYSVEDGNFIIFKDNPDLYYYTQSAEQGRFNYIAAGATKAYGAFLTKKGLDKVPTNKIPTEKVPMLDKIIGKIPESAKHTGKYFGGWWLNDNIPIVREVIGTEVPKVGDKEVILYVSEDGVNWDHGVRFVVKKGEDPKSEKFQPNQW